MYRRDEHRADVPAVPAAIRSLAAKQVVERGLLVPAPSQLVAFFAARAEQPVPAVVAKDVVRLGIIVVRVLIVAEAVEAASGDGDVRLAELEPSLDQLRVVLAGAEAARDRRRGQSRPAVAAATAAQAIDNAA